ncbi:hypothetical protein A7J50_4021 [Pseudomonas antarctica]|jgi:catechol 2,3-dioxygenase-like lactoylglutathione lyase family enzyme|uniref:VOC domain-containing protein n=1 Tax=Pseudomonas antarctica TaxID=219572 RepID=A0A172Z4A0_9PSED|nr:VOC family protein [Pseudomonas antarctica]ANF87383.1 hypothetical protein A7J50_4021 [Pseudomonas antarctica]MBX7277660.1 VOC family protein [Pseudomonas sp. ERGC3:01]QZC96827.1 VOC family protein [Pseudomonas sp. ERGC3:05]
MEPLKFTACLAVRDVTETLDFFERIGYVVTRESIAPPHSIHMILDGDNPLFMIQPEHEVKEFMPFLAGYPVGGSGFFYINTEEFDVTVARIKGKAEVLKESSEGGYKIFYFKDPNGYVFGINELISE